MKKCTAYKFEFAEAQEVLRNCLDDATVKLRKNGCYYEAVSDNMVFYGGRVDECFAQILGVSECKQYAVDDGIIVLVEEPEESCGTMYVSDLIELMKGKDENKNIVVQLPDETLVTLDNLKYVEDEIFYLHKHPESEEQDFLTVGKLKFLLESEASDECWAHSLYNDNCSRFEDCEVKFANGTFDEFESEDFVGDVFYLSAAVRETDKEIVLVCEKE